MFGRLNGIVFGALLFLTSLLGSVYLLLPFLPLAFFAPRQWRWCADRLVGYWLTFPASMIFFLFGVKIHLGGDIIEKDEPAIIIMNHRTRLDWLFFWNALYKMDPWLLTTEKISMKAALKSIPGAGWAMGCAAYIFLNRKYADDQRVLENMLKYYKDSTHNYQLLLFPEGTDRGERAARISNAYADKHKLPRYDYVLHPRTTGFNYILNHMRKLGYVKYVYDVTVAYPNSVVQSEQELIKDGIFPEEVHFDVKKYDLADVVNGVEDKDVEVDASEWLTQLWKEKEERLREFYVEGSRLLPSGRGIVWPMAEPPTVVETDLHAKVRGWLFCTAMLLSAMFGTMYILFPLVPLIFINPTLYRVLVDRLVGFWLVMPSGFIEYVFGVKYLVRGTLIDHTKPALIIMNHRTRLDWLFFWNALFRMDPWLLTSEKISLKAILKHVPGAGWAMASNAFMFLDRTFDRDAARINMLIDYYANSGHNYQLLLFPEGTDKCPLATGRSKKYADKSGLVHYDYVLHPRQTGFSHIIQKMRSSNYIETVYDVTVGYPGEIVQSELDLFLKGACPKTVHFDVRKIDIKDIPTEEGAIGKWLADLWAAKEERLRQYYAKPQSERQLDSLPNDVEFKLTFRTRLVQIYMISAWCFMTVMWIYMFFTYSYQFLWMLAVFTFFLGCQYGYCGLEWLLAEQAKKPALAHWFGLSETEKKKK